MSQQPHHPAPAPDANRVLMGGGGPPGWKFADPGATHAGHVAEPPQSKQEREYDPRNPGGGAPKTFPSGDPIMGVHVVMQTDERNPSIERDDGRRTFYIEGQYLKAAVREAIAAQGRDGLYVGDYLWVQFTHREDPNDTRSRKHWDVRYWPAAQQALMTEPQQAPAAPPAQAGPPPQAPVPAASQPPTPPQAPAPPPPPPPPHGAPQGPPATGYATPPPQGPPVAAPPSTNPTGAPPAPQYAPPGNDAAAAALANWQAQQGHPQGG